MFRSSLFLGFAFAAACGLPGLIGAEAPAGAAAPVAVLKIDAGRVTAHVSPTLYGLMTEEINHSYDGGLYGELVQNRAFLDDPKTPVHWALVQKNGGVGTMTLDDNQPLNAALTACLRLDISAASEKQPFGMANDGFWGIPIRPFTHYRASLYIKSAGDYSGKVTVSLESADGRTVLASGLIPHPADWKRYTVDLTTGDVPPSTHNRLVISGTHSGILWIDLVSLFPPTWRDRPNGNRIDLMQKLADLHPAFLRFPGGNYVEGDHIADRFNWKTTLHGLDQRMGHPSPWGYRSSDGMGLLEYLEWCEDLQMQPVLAVFAGYALKGEFIAGGPKLQPFVQDALDEIEYIAGGADTKWGAERIADGHPAPFKLTYVEIGNEDNADKSGSYDGRFAQFYDAIKARYPALQVIATTAVKSRMPDVYDEHFYEPAKRFEEIVHRYDGYSRSGPKIFVGEWATYEGSPTPNLGAALGDAVWMTGLERNSDLVVMASYAPLFVNVNPGASQWKTNLIGYDALSSFGSPSYYAQAMFSGHHGDTILASSCDAGARFYYSVTRDTWTGVIYVKAVNPTGEARTVRMEIAGVAAVAPQGAAIVLSSADPADTNSPGNPARIVPVESKLEGAGLRFTRRFEPYSVTVLELPAR